MYVYLRLCTEELTVGDLMFTPAVCTSGPAALLLFLLPKFSCFLERRGWSMGTIDSDCTPHANLLLRDGEKMFAATAFSLLSISFPSVFVRASASMDITTDSKAFN